MSKAQRIKQERLADTRTTKAQRMEAKKILPKYYKTLQSLHPVAGKFRLQMFSHSKAYRLLKGSYMTLKVLVAPKWRAV